LGKDSAGESKESVEALNKAAGFLRSKISQVVQMRTTPRLSFFYDSSIKRGTDLSALIDKAVKSDESHHDSDPLGNEE
jgi:ribosome-binding factor A